jgi:hypothetical protein
MKMTKINDEKINDKLDIDLDYIDIQNLSIEEIDKEMNDFYIDKEKIESIKAPDDMKIWVKEAIDRAEKDMKAEKIRKKVIPVAASIGIILTIGIYNPVLVHAMPPLQKLLQSINNVLHVNEIASKTNLDEIIPKLTLDEDGKIMFIKAPEYIIEGKNNEVNVEIEEKSKNMNKWDVYTPVDEYGTVQFIHQMSNGIINPIDGMKIGYIEINPRTIDIAIEGLQYIQHESARKYLYVELSKWKSGNFDNGVNIHNYVWNMLNGNVGKAVSIDYGEVEKIKNNHFR